MMRSHEEISELLGAYALDAVDGDERAVVEEHLASCPRCAAEVAEHREVAAKLAYTGAPAPDGLWARIVEALEETPPTMSLFPPTPVPPTPAPTGGEARIVEFPPSRSRWRWIPMGAVAAGLVVVGIFAGLVIGDDPVTPESTDVAAPVSIEDIARQVLNDPDSSKVSLASLTDENLKATAAVDDDGSGYLLGTSLPALDDSQTYQLWGVRKDAVISLGLLGHSPGVIAFHLDDNINALVITAEVAGGVPQSANPALLVGNVV